MGHDSSIGLLYIFHLLNNAGDISVQDSAVCSHSAASAPQLAAIPTAKVSLASPIYP